MGNVIRCETCGQTYWVPVEATEPIKRFGRYVAPIGGQTRCMDCALK